MGRNEGSDIDVDLAPARPVPLLKQDSMWATLAVDRFVTSYDSSRSYAGRDDVSTLVFLVA
jgi:hypothetical protein